MIAPLLDDPAIFTGNNTGVFLKQLPLLKGFLSFSTKALKWKNIGKARDNAHKLSLLKGTLCP